LFFWLIGTPLCAVRKPIAHGRVFSTDQEWFRVVSAKHHLLWTLEKSFLCVSGWPIEQEQGVGAKPCVGMTLYAGCRRDRDRFVVAK
jgi:hypothetical protein